MPVPLPQHHLGGRPVELEKVLQPPSQMWIAGGSTQRHTLQQTQGVRSRQPAVLAHPAIDTEQADGESPSVQADGDQMGQRALGPGASKEMQMTVFPIAAVAVIETLGTAARGHQIASGVVLVRNWRSPGGESPHQGPVAFDQTQPVMKRLPCRSIAGAGVHPQREGPQPPSCAPHPPATGADPLLTPLGFGLDDGEACGAETR